jgi:hypothetical protein
VCNGRSYYPEAHQWALEKNLTFIGNSDIHEPSGFQAYEPADHRTLTLVFAENRTLESVHEALAAGRTAVWYENQLIGRRPLLQAMFDACVVIHPPHHRSENSAWVRIDNNSELNIELVRTGERGPKGISLPAGTSTDVRFRTTDDGLSGEFPYRTDNFLVGPDEGLSVTLAIPGSSEAPGEAETPRRPVAVGR